MFKKLCAIVLLCCLSTVSLAQTDSEKAMQAQTLREAAKILEGVENNTPDISKVAEWGQQASVAAKGFAEAIGIAAKEVGVSVNEFIETDAGKIATVLIIWHVIGDDIAKLFCAMLVLVGGCILAVKLFKFEAISEYKSVDKIYFWGLLKTTKQVPVYKTSSDIKHSEGGFIVSSVVFVVVSILVAVLIIISI